MSKSRMAHFFIDFRGLTSPQWAKERYCLKKIVIFVQKTEAPSLETLALDSALKGEFNFICIFAFSRLSRMTRQPKTLKTQYFP
jgi:hypothetical protein